MSVYSYIYSYERGYFIYQMNTVNEKRSSLHCKKNQYFNCTVYKGKWNNIIHYYIVIELDYILLGTEL